MAANPKNSALQLLFKPLVQISMMHLCGFGESFLMLCTVFLRLNVLPRNLITLLLFLGYFLLRLSCNGVEADQEGGVYTESVE